MRIEEVVGERIREARTELGLTQAQLGGRMESQLGRRWSRQAISQMEKGERDFGIAQLIALSKVLDVSPIELMLPAAGSEPIDVAGVLLSADDIIKIILNPVGQRLVDDMAASNVKTNVHLASLVVEPLRLTADLLTETAARIRSEVDRTQALVDGGLELVRLQEGRQ